MIYSHKLFKYAFCLLFSGKTFSNAISVETMNFKMKISTKSHADIFGPARYNSKQMKLGFSWKVLVYSASSCSFCIREVYKTNRFSLKQLHEVFCKISLSRNGNF